MKFFLYLKMLIIFSIALTSCEGAIITTLGDASVDTLDEGGRTLYLIDTSSDGIIYKKDNAQLVKVFPSSRVKLYDNNEFRLESGAVATFNELTENSGSFDITLFVNPQWGGSSFIRFMVPQEQGELNGKMAIQYLMVDGSKHTIDTKLHNLFSYGGFNYFGCYIPFNIYWKLKGLDMRAELFRSGEREAEPVCEVQIIQAVAEKEFITQDIKFRSSKSRELSNTSYSRYKEEHKERRAIWAENNSLTYLSNGFNFPLERMERISSEFGLARRWLLSSGKVYSQNIHLGVDYPKPKGTPVYAAGDGIVRYTHNGAYVGNTVIIEHGLSVFTDYSHMDTITVKEGQTVKKGEQIGTVGMTGASTGNHLHWGMRIYGLPVDPRSLLTADDIFIP